MKKTSLAAFGLLYGVPDEIPAIPGFEIAASPARWLLATQGHRQFFVEKMPRGHRLYPRTRLGKVRRDQAIYIGAENQEPRTKNQELP